MSTVFLRRTEAFKTTTAEPYGKKEMNLLTSGTTVTHGHINTDGKPAQDGGSTSMDVDSRMNFASIEDAQAFIDNFDFADADPKFKLEIV